MWLERWATSARRSSALGRPAPARPLAPAGRRYGARRRGRLPSQARTSPGTMSAPCFPQNAPTVPSAKRPRPPALGPPAHGVARALPFPGPGPARDAHARGRRSALCVRRERLGHPQPPTLIHIDNKTDVGIVNSTIKRQRSRSMEMRSFWLLDQASQKYFKLYYQPGTELLADYPRKAHIGPIHTHVRPYYLHMKKMPTQLLRAA